MRSVSVWQGQHPSTMLAVCVDHAEPFTAYLPASGQGESPGSGFFLVQYPKGTNTLTYFPQAFTSDLALSSSFLCSVPSTPPAPFLSFLLI